MNSNTASSGWHFVSGAEIPVAIEEVWSVYNDTLNGGQPALDWQYVSLLYEYFKGGYELLAVSRHAIALIQPDRLGRWSTFLPSQSCVGPIMFSRQLDAAEVHELCASLASALPRTTTMVALRKQDPRIAQLQSEHVSDSFESSVYGTTTDIDTNGSFDDYWGQRSKKLRQELRRKIRTVEKEGVALTLRKLDQPERMSSAIAEHAALEMGGWKGKAGTALDGSNLQSRFYDTLLTRMSENAKASAYQLLFDDKVGASLLTISGNGTMIILKTAYDESISRFSPGRLIDYAMLPDVFADPRISVIENYTVSTSEDRRWCTGNREIIDYNFFPSSVVKRAVNASRNMRVWFRKQPPITKT